MKNIYPFLITVCLFTSCAKTVDNNINDSLQKKSTQTLYSPNLVTQVGENGPTLTITMDPVAVFYTDNKPGDIFVYMTCSLSAPSDKYISVTVEKTVDERVTNSIILVIPPNVTNTTFNTNITNEGDNIVADQFKITRVNAYNMMQ